MRRTGGRRSGAALRFEGGGSGGELRRKYLWVLTALVAVFAFVLGFIGGVR